MKHCKYVFVFLIFLFNQWAICQRHSLLSILTDEAALDSLVSLEYESNINTNLWEYSPTLYENGVIYVGTRRNFKIIDNTHDTPFFALKYSEFNPDGTLSFPVPFLIEGAVENHDGPITVTENGQAIIFTKSVPIIEGERKQKVPLHLYRAELTRDGWIADSEPLAFQKKGFTYAHPAYDSKTNRLYFSSNIPDGYGGMDLYYIELSDNASPVNLGSNVNTEGNEVFPTVYENLVFFSSDGFEKTEDLDIYATYLTNNKTWVDPVKLAPPFNGNSDDLGLIFNTDATSGYFSSQRSQGKGKDDILRVESQVSLINKKSQLIDYEIITKEKSSQKRLEGISVWLIETDENGLAKNKDIYESRFDMLANGERTLRLKIKDPTQLPEATNVTDINGSAKVKIDTTKQYIILASSSEYDPEVMVKNNWDSFSNKEILELSHNACIPAYIETKIDVVKEYQVMLSYTNECTGEFSSQTVTISPELRENSRENRYKLDDVCLKPDCHYTFVIHSSEGTDTNIILIPRSSQEFIVLPVKLMKKSPKELESMKDKEEIQRTKNLKKGDVITLRSIYYDYNKSAIRKGAAHELDALIQLLKVNANMKIEFNSFTDARGNAQYNLKLSLDRAEAAKNYLIARGISSERIRTVGYGEGFLKNHCSDGVRCSEEEHQYNRRTEVRILE